ALSARGAAMAKGWVGSLTLGVGQFCTNPGVVIGLAGPDLDGFVAAAVDAAAGGTPQPMLTTGIAQAYRAALDARGGADLKTTPGAGDNAHPAIYVVDGARWRADDSLRHEVFGPAGVVVGCADQAEMVAIAQELEGQLTATLQMDDADLPLAAELTPILMRKAGRLLRNGFPTGVEVCGAMMHGGPYPASTESRTTSVGSLAIQRFLRPIAFQDFHADLLPTSLRR
ncbi:MAG: aldehyde dehydrogenase (NADP(+)), partial [Pseudomonadota bacterium]